MKSAIVGCGSIAEVHTHVLMNEYIDAEICAFVDIIPERAEKLAAVYGKKTSVYTSFEEMLNIHPDIDVVHICTPHYCHTQMAAEAVSRSINVFTEKPPSISKDQFQSFLNLGDSSQNTRIGVCFQNRFNDSVNFILGMLGKKTYIPKEDLTIPTPFIIGNPLDINNTEKYPDPGEVLSVRAFLTWHRTEPYYTNSGWRGSMAKEGGGCLINQAIHTLDLMLQFLGRPSHVSSNAANHHLKNIIEVEDTLEAYMEFPGKRPGLFYASTAFSKDAPVIVELVCENFTVRMEETEVSIISKNGKYIYDFSSKQAMTHGKSYWGTSHLRCINHFYHSLRNDKKFLITPSDVQDTMETMFEIYECAGLYNGIFSKEAI